MIEINIVKTSGFSSEVFELVARTRVIANGANDQLKAVAAFIEENADIFTAACGDAATFVHMQELTIDGFYGLKYLLSNYGLDIIITTVSDDEYNAQEIQPGVVEYNVVDCLSDGLAKNAYKIVSEPEDKLMDIYNDIFNSFDFFGNPAFAALKNPSKTVLASAQMQEHTLGTCPNMSAAYIKETLNFLGKKIIAIQA